MDADGSRIRRPMVARSRRADSAENDPRRPARHWRPLREEPLPGAGPREDAIDERLSERRPDSGCGCEAVTPDVGNGPSRRDDHGEHDQREDSMNRQWGRPDEDQDAGERGDEWYADDVRE